jgi:hypothetical protein
VKVLLDEDLPHKLRTAILNHDVSTVAYPGWDGLQNGELLKATDDAGFDVFLTADKKMSKQQNLEKRNLAIVVLSTVEWVIMKPYIGTIQIAVDVAKPGSFQSVECGEFRR